MGLSVTPTRQVSLGLNIISNNIQIKSAFYESDVTLYFHFSIDVQDSTCFSIRRPRNGSQRPRNLESNDSSLVSLLDFFAR